MSQINYTPQRYTVLENANDASNIGKALYVPDFKTRQLDLDCDNTLDGDLVVFESNQKDVPPDITIAASATNEYFPVGYTNKANGVYFASNLPYNPVGLGRGSFNVETTGSRWIIAAFINRVAGTVQKLSVTCFDNQ